jgi:5'(3')-deoxyribonucleotidase
MRKENMKPLLMDCDGVVADFVGATIKIANQNGFELTNNDVKHDTRRYPYWDVCGLEQIVKGPGFCESIPVIEGSQEFVERVRSAGINVVFVTSPMKESKHWHWERQQWLEKHFGVKRTNLIYATEKRFVNGFAFLDDHVGNVLDWQDYNNSHAVLVKQPWNEDVLKDTQAESPISLWHEKRKQSIVRTDDWNKIYEFVIERNKQINSDYLL